MSKPVKKGSQIALAIKDDSPTQSVFLFERRGMECGFIEYEISQDQLNKLKPTNESLPDLFQVFMRRLERRARELFEI